MDSISVDIAQLNAQYKPFLAFSEWAKVTLAEDQWTTQSKAILDAANGQEDLLERAIEVAKRAAAIETGAIEGLYEIDRGVTLTIATQGAMWSAALQQHQKAKSYIDAQLGAYDYVLDFATKRTPLAAAWIRELHSVVCEAQKTYVVHTANGPEDRPLPRGEYKRQPNHVQLSDGSIHVYAPVEATEAEINRLIQEVNSPAFDQAHAAIQAAYVHHAFTSVHPFQDGNGRVARALASVFSYRKARIPLLILSESKSRYLDALEQADGGVVRPFVEFVFEAGMLALRLVEQSIHTARLPSPLEAAKRASRLNYTRGGILHDHVDQAAVRLVGVLGAQATEVIKQLGDEVQFGLNIANVAPIAPPDGYRNPLSSEPRMATLGLRLKPPAEAHVEVTFRTFVPIDCGDGDVFLLTCNELDSTLRVPVHDVIPEGSLGLELLLRMWFEARMSEALARLLEKGQARMQKRGYGIVG